MLWCPNLFPLLGLVQSSIYRHCADFIIVIMSRQTVKTLIIAPFYLANLTQHDPHPPQSLMTDRSCDMGLPLPQRLSGVPVRSGTTWRQTDGLNHHAAGTRRAHGNQHQANPPATHVRGINLSTALTV